MDSMLNATLQSPLDTQLRPLNSVTPELTPFAQTNAPMYRADTGISSNQSVVNLGVSRDFAEKQFKMQISQIRQMEADAATKKSMIEGLIADYANNSRGLQNDKANRRVMGGMENILVGMGDSISSMISLVPDILGKTLATVGLGDNLYSPEKALSEAYSRALEFDKQYIRDHLKEHYAYNWFSDRGA
jgi:hypothetical protein